MDHFRFLDLPREVRDLIYAENAKDIRMEVSRRTTNGRRWTFNIMEQQTSAATLRLPGRRAALPDTCRQIRTEILDYVVANPAALYVEETHKMTIPTIVLNKCLPLAMRPRLRCINIDTDTGQPTFISGPMVYADTKYYNLAGELMSTCPQLQHVNIRDSKPFHYSFFKATNTQQHGTIFKTLMHQQLWCIRRIYDYYQSKGLVLSLNVTYNLSDSSQGSPLTCWVRSHTTKLVCMLTRTGMQILQGSSERRRPLNPAQTPTRRSRNCSRALLDTKKGMKLRNSAN